VTDAVWTYHTNPLTCGVAKFNWQLADRLGVPCESLGLQPRACPLVSVKPSEIAEALSFFAPVYDLFLHDFEVTPRNVAWVIGARRIYAGNNVIADAVEDMRPDVIEAWCPSLLQPSRPAGNYRVLLFGMGHKRQAAHLGQLRKLLDASRFDYTIEASTGIHEGSPWDAGWHASARVLHEIFGSRLRLLGYLADDALADAIATASLMALFYDPAARANNTSLWAALNSGRPVITNLDGESPSVLVHGETVLDLYQMRSLLERMVVKVGPAGQAAAQAYSWPRLMSIMVA